ncbi:N-acetylneuraminate synthase family protein, partial [candidate division WOR-3 bacterium]|nr:N-acetylneuraminate synthase family protein [candidate division WOR-3 bacterium]
LGIEVPIAAVAMGAPVIEKHFTLDKGLKGPDHKMSLNPENFSIMINNIKNVLIMLGSGKKPLIKQEEIIKKEIRKSIYTNSEIKEGDKLSTDNTVLLRPQMGLTAAKYEYFTGKRFRKNKNAYKPVRAGDLT